jgi:hypothetical protein
MFSRRRVRGIVRERRGLWSVIKIQSLIRKCLAVRLFDTLKRDLARRNKAATAIQCMYRMWKARKRVRERKHVR